MNNSTPCAPSELIPWLTHTHSITDKLNLLTPHTKLEVLRHEWGPADPWDHQTLAMHESALHREILMWASTNRCWYARTILPHSTYLANAVLFDRLNHEPLGRLIWDNPNIKRIICTPFPIQQHAIEYSFLTPSMHQNSDLLWGRLSTFTINNTSLFYLLEIFLPQFRIYCQ